MPFVPRRVCHAIWPAAAALLVAATPASAAWGPVVRPPLSTGASQLTLAVDPAGDAAAAWVVEGSHSVRVRAAFVRPSGGVSVRTLVSASGDAVQSPRVVLDRRGELTVAWVQRSARDRHQTIRAAYRTAAGRWSSVQDVSRTSAFYYASPRLAAAPDGAVALTFNAAVRAAPGVGAAWRSRGHAFGRVQSVATGRRAYLFEPSLAFDPSGRAYLTGIARCDDEQRSAGALFTTTAGGRRFGAQRIVTPEGSTHLRFVVTGRGAGVALWLDAGCSTSEDLSGPVQAAVMRSGRVGAPMTLTTVSSTAPVLSVAPGGAGDASWTAFTPSAGDGEVLASRIAADGTASTAATPVNGLAAAVGDAHGDQVVQLVRPRDYGGNVSAGALDADTGTVLTAPFARALPAAVAGTSSGRALTAGLVLRTGVVLGVWRPGA